MATNEMATSWVPAGIEYRYLIHYQKKRKGKNSVNTVPEELELLGQCY